MKKENFEITGMSCASCAANVNNAVCTLPGVKDVNVNLISNNMTVEYDESSVDCKTIIQAVKKAGYGATIENKELNTAQRITQKSVRNEINIKKMKKRLVLSTFFWILLMSTCFYQMFVIRSGIKIENISGVKMFIYKYFAIIQILLLIPIIVLNRRYYTSGFRSLVKLKPNMDTLVAIGSTAAIVFGLITSYENYFSLASSELAIFKDYYFDSAGTILTLITIGKYLEEKSKGKTGDAISKLINLAPKTAILVKDGNEIEIPTDKIQSGDIILIKPGAKIPVDGEVVKGTSSVDESAITGESIPVLKEVGSKVISGTINKNGVIKVETEKTQDQTVLAQIIKLVEEAGNSKAPISRLADRVAAVFVPVVIIIAVITAIIWYLIQKDVAMALNFGISVLVVSCPCALGLATPLVIMIATGKAAEKGILVKSAESIETLHSIDTVLLDKTGTITKGEPQVIQIVTNEDILINENTNKKIKIIGNINNKVNLEKRLLKIAGSLEKNSEHPLAEAINNIVKNENIKILPVQNFVTVSGKGIKGMLDGQTYFGGNLSLMYENNINTSFYENKAVELENAGNTVLYFADEKEVIGLFAVSDTVKDSSFDAIKRIKARGIETIMVTGDNQIVADSIGKQSGVDKVIAGVLPQDKEKEVRSIQSKGKRVAFVGDGINDSPALASANVGIAIGSGTDIAIESADIVLIKSDLTDVDTAIDLSKKTINNIKLSLFWAFFYNVISIPVAAGLFYLSFGIKLNPMIGAAAMSLSSICVCLNALRLKKA